MRMTTTNFMLASGILPALQQFGTETKLHPILVNFTAALVPIPVGSDLAARFFKNESIRNAAWWTLYYTVEITPFTTNWAIDRPFDVKPDAGIFGQTLDIVQASTK